MLNVVLDADGRVIACGETDSLIAPEGGQIIQSDTDPLAGLAAGQEAVWDGSKFTARTRQLSAEEQARKDAKAKVVTLAQSTVGVNITDLATAQRLALVAVLLYQADALNGDGTVRPLARWVRG